MILDRLRALIRMKLQGIVPKHQVLDNKISAAYKSEIQATHMTYHIFPPGDHCRKIAEKAIQTRKDHCVGVLTGTVSTFPMQLWCQTMPQAEHQLLLLRQSNVNPQISTYAHVYGHHNYDVEPLFPIGMESLVHNKPRHRKLFAEHCKQGYVLGTNFEHYRTWNIWIKASRATIISVTVFHQHRYISNPTVTPVDAVIAAIENLTATLKNKIPQCLQSSPLNEITRLGTILADMTETRAAHPVKPLQPVTPSLPKTNLIPTPKCLLSAPLTRVAPVPRVAPP